MATTRDELIGRTVLELLPGFAESGPLSYYAQCLETGQPGTLDDYAYGPRDPSQQSALRRQDRSGWKRPHQPGLLTPIPTGIRLSRNRNLARVGDFARRRPRTLSMTPDMTVSTWGVRSGCGARPSSLHSVGRLPSHGAVPFVHRDQRHWDVVGVVHGTHGREAGDRRAPADAGAVIERPTRVRCRAQGFAGLSSTTTLCSSPVNLKGTS